MFRICWFDGVAPGNVKAGGVKVIVSAKYMGPVGLPSALGPRGPKPQDPGTQRPKDLGTLGALGPSSPEDQRPRLGEGKPPAQRNIMQLAPPANPLFVSTPRYFLLVPFGPYKF